VTEILEQVEQAKYWLKQKGELSGCSSYVQRKLQCGYNRACTILDILVQDGFITEPDAVGNRHFRDAVGNAPETNR
jgi:S-DNA-T family DNA segregation ATPase FtsK/SpoIIIE